MDYTQILSRLFIGPHPRSSGDVDALRNKAGITAVLNLQTDEDMRSCKIPWERLEAHYGTCRIELCRVPVRDEISALQEKLPECVRALHRLLGARHSVYVHCTFGAGRSPTVAVAYLHWCSGWGLAPALTYVKQLRQCSPNLEAIWQAAWDPAS